MRNADEPEELAFLAGEGTVTHAMNMKSTQDGRYLLSKPYNIAPEYLNVWMWEPGGTAPRG